MCEKYQYEIFLLFDTGFCKKHLISYDFPGYFSLCAKIYGFDTRFCFLGYQISGFFYIDTD